VRVLVDTSLTLRGPSATGVYVAHLVPALQAAGLEVVEAANGARRAAGGAPLRSAVNLATDALWIQRELPRRAREQAADVLHHPHPALARGVAAPPAQVLTVHDLAVVDRPEGADPRRRRYVLRAHRAAARRAHAVIAVSQATADDVHARWGVPVERIVVARHGPGQEPEARRPRAREATHLLYVGDDEPRKNLDLLLAGYARYRAQAGPAPLPLVLAGRTDAAGEGVRVVARPDAEELAELYAGAAALVHPSLHEGFGLVALEAMSAGTPVLAARTAGLQEVCGDAAQYVDGRDAQGLADELARLAADPGLRRDLAERGRRRAAEFSWARSARAHAAAYALAVAVSRTQRAPAG
jgi:glycosyltransferase involved in cell wall biosynthesis